MALPDNDGIESGFRIRPDVVGYIGLAVLALLTLYNILPDNDGITNLPDGGK